MTYSYSTNTKQHPVTKQVSVTNLVINEKDIVVSFSDTLREAFYTLFERQVQEICKGLKVILQWRFGYDSVRIHLPKNVLQDTICTLKNFLQRFTFSLAI